MAELPSPLALCGAFLAATGAVAGGLAFLGVQRGDLDPVTALGGAAIIVAILGGAQLLAASRLLRGLRAFAEEVGGAPEVASDRFGEAGLRWADLGIAVWGSAYKFHVAGFHVRAGDRTWPARVGHARDAAREALALAGRPQEPRGAWDGRVPSAATPGTVAGIAVGAALVAALADIAGAPALPVGVGVGALALGLLLWGDAGLRRGVGALLRGWSAEGVRVEAPVLAWPGFHPRWSVLTSEGPVSLEGFALGPLDRLFVDRAGEGRRVPLARADADGRALARAWRKA